MTYTLRIGVLAGIVVLGTAPAVSAQREPNNGACFYEDSNFDGDYICLRTGEDMRSVPRKMNDKITSIRIFGRAEATVYQNSGFGGESETFYGDIRHLRSEGWNDRISSIQVTNGSFRSSGRRSNRGNSRDVDRIVRRAYQDVLDREPDTAGLRLYRSRMLDDGWSERQVREALRESPEYRRLNTMTYEKARKIVRDAYLNVLKREPDNGSANYVNRVMRDKWTQADVERELRRSDEYRNRGRH